MKFVFHWLLAGVFSLLCAVVPAHAQNTTLPPGSAALARTPAALVALSTEGALSRSADNGVTFSPIRAADSPRALYTLAASANTVVAIGDGSTFVRSVDSGFTYNTLTRAVTTTVISATGAIHGLNANGTTWVAVGKANASSIAILLSTTDGATWTGATTVPAVTNGQLRGVAWTGSRWLAVGKSTSGGFILTSTDGNTWTSLTTTFDGLNAIATNGAGKVLIVGDVGTVLYATDGGATAGSFTSVGDNVVSEDLQAVAFLSGDNWIIGGNSSVLVSFNGTATGLVRDVVPGTGAPVTALLSTGSGANYYVSDPIPHGPISLQIALVSGQLQLTLVGAETGNTYHIESSATLAAFLAVNGSNRVFSGGPAPSWTFPAPTAGQRIFYRAKLGLAP